MVGSIQLLISGVLGIVIGILLILVFKSKSTPKSNELKLPLLHEGVDANNLLTILIAQKTARANEIFEIVSPLEAEYNQLNSDLKRLKQIKGDTQ